MERCTIRLKTGEARCSQLDGNVVVERLAAYEDTGLKCDKYEEGDLNVWKSKIES